MSNSKTILLISQIHPYPHFDGGRMDVYFRIKALSELGHRVILISFFNPLLTVPETSVLENFCQKVFTIPYDRRNIRKFFAFKPYSIACREVWGEIDRVLDILKKDKCAIDAIIAESPHVMTVVERAKAELDIPQVYLRFHNDEPRFMRSVALSSSLFSIERVFFLAEAIKYKSYFPKMMNAFDDSVTIWHISFDEFMIFEKRFPHLKHQFLPAGIDISRLQQTRIQHSKKVIFAGALFSPNNVHGLKWYLREVHPLLLNEDHDYQLIIAGNSSGANPKDLKYFKNHDRVIFYDTPKCMDSLYEEAQVFINPMLLGAGVKLKTLDAALRGLPVVTTTIGNEGTGFTNENEVLVADEPKEFKNHLISLLKSKEKCSRLSEAAVEFLRVSYDQKQMLEKVLN